MDWKNLKSVATRIKRLTKEIEAIDASFYGLGEDFDPVVAAGVLEHKRDDIVRSIVLQLHTSIEDLLNLLILYCVLNVTEEKQKWRLRSKKAKAIRRMLYGAGSIGFDMKLNFAVGLGLLTTSLQARLVELNNMRNKCSHNWILNKVVRQGKGRRQKKPPLLLFRGRDLHKLPVLRELMGEQNKIYLHLYGKWVS